MMTLLGFAIRGVRFFWGVKQPQTNRLVIDLYFGQPLAVFFANALKTAFILRVGPVVRVLKIGRFTKVFKTVVSSNAVNVVYLICRPISSHIEPRQTVRQIKRVVYAYDAVSVPHRATRSFTDAAPTSFFGPSKFSRLLVIMHQFSQPICRKFHNILHIPRDCVNINKAAFGGQI